jgi:adenylate cyclase
MSDPADSVPNDSNTRRYLKKLLAERNQFPDRAGTLDAEIHRVFGRKVAILVLDMCGFSNTTAQYGIIHFLAMIDEMEQGAVPAVVDNGGQVIKLDADNLFAIFSEPAQAVEAALDIFRAFDAINAVVPENRDIRGSVGIGFGHLLVIGEEDVFGEEMNYASKLGEDIGAAKDILLTPAACELLPPGRYECAAETFSIAGRNFKAYRFLRSLYPSVGER